MIWHFPLPRTHTGVLLGNGRQGLMVWGDQKLHVTVGRAGFWDHRGGTDFTAKVDFAALRKMLETGDEAGIRKAFTGGQGKVEYPRQIGCGRLDLRFVDGLRPVRGQLDIYTGTLTVSLANERGNTASVRIRQGMGRDVAWIESGVVAEIVARPAWDFIESEMAEIGCEEPERWRGTEAGGFCQRLPADDPLALAWRRSEARIFVGTALGADARLVAQALVNGVEDFAGMEEASNSWWREYWTDTPRVSLPDEILQEAWNYGLYKQAGLTTPGAPAATLQGPWMEEYQLPPWSNDYHFNINAQMIYWPCLSTNRLGHFAPLWEMIRGWLPHLRANAEKFFGAKDALMLPHAVDDRCSVVGAFWTGTIDHACTAWVAQMAWLHYRYSMDEEILGGVAWPLLNGAFNGYWAMIEEVEGRLSLPVSVSPEFGGAGMSAWGRDASFQLAACHFLARTLPRAAELLGEPVDARWADVERRLPLYTVCDPNRGIALWEGKNFDQTHRHHSHLGAIYPFCTIDPADPAHAEVVWKSFVNWNWLGSGSWTGWCVPWASILCSRCGFADAAVAWLHWWREIFVNIGRGTLHDRDFAGAGGLGGPPIQGEPKPEGYREVMQMDAGLGVVTAVSELLVQCRGRHGERIVVLPRIPSRWREVEFDGVRAEGAFLIGATVRNGRREEVRVTSLAGERLELEHGLGEGVVVEHGGKVRTISGPVLCVDAVAAGERLILRGTGR